MDISQFVSDHPVAICIVALAILFFLVGYYYWDDEDDTDAIVASSHEKYDIRCTVPGQVELVFQDIPENEFSFDYDGFVCVERGGKYYYLPIQYTTVLPNV
mgnify:CR=1 FL=1